MTYYDLQHVFPSQSKNSSPTLSYSRGSCPSLWDSENAKFSTCALPYLSIIPIAFVIFVFINYLIVPRIDRWRPDWAKPFIIELPDEQDELSRGIEKNGLSWTLALLGAACIGLIAQIVQLSLTRDISTLILLTSWILFALLIAITRPRGCPTSFLTFYISALVIELLFIFNIDLPHSVRDAPHIAAAAAATLSISIMLAMPFRPVTMSTEGIGPVGSTPTSKLRSPEDNLRLWQFMTISWMSPLISVGKYRQLNFDDVWFLGYQFQHKRLHEKFRRLKGSVLSRLIQANAVDIFIISTLAAVKISSDFAAPVLLQQLLRAMEDAHSPKRVALTYATISLIVSYIAAQSEVANVWYGRRCYERSRGEMVMMVYQKALSRKNVIPSKEGREHERTSERNQNGHAENGGAENGHTQNGNAQNGHAENGSAANGHAQNGNTANGHTNPKSDRKWRFYPKFPWSSKSKALQTNEPASMGKIFNLLRGDVYEVAQRFWEVGLLFEKPFGLVVAVILVWKLLGPSCFIGIIAVLVAQVINAFLTRILLDRSRLRRIATDDRLQVTSQFVEAIRHLRWYGWQNHWLRRVMDARRNELHTRVIVLLWNIVIVFVNSFASGIFPVAALYGYTVLSGHTLRIDIIFPALQLFTMLQQALQEIPNLITVLINAYVAIVRIEEFMNEPDKGSEHGGSTLESSSMQLIDCTFAWPGSASPILVNLNLTFPEGLTVVCGKVGAGKSALLQGLLGELDNLAGIGKIPNEMIGYCAQTPWLQSMSIRDNILFSSPYEEDRYRRVLDSCALLPDLASFKNGDLTFIGENGTGLSGGQKARVALARAVYSRANILLLDDPISALDHNTAESVVRKCFLGPLMKGRTIVLVTHRTELVHHLAVQIVEVADRTASICDKDKFADGVAYGSSDANADGEEEVEVGEDQETAAIPEKFMDEEHRAEWGVKARVYWTYVKAGTLRWWALLVIILTVYRLLTVAESWFLKAWGEAYDQVVHALLSDLRGQGRRLFNSKLTASSKSPDIRTYNNSLNPIDNLPPPAEDVLPWLAAYLVITVSQSVTLLVAQLAMVVLIYYASKQLFERVMQRVSQATFRFFDVTPVGRLMNRLTSDMGTVDGNISQQFQQIAFQMITWATSMVVIASVTPTFLVFSFALTAAFVTIFLHFLPASQSLRRLEMVSLTPLLSNFGELLHGLTTVRAFHAEERFQNRVINVVDEFQGMDHFYWSLQNWLSYRFGNMSGVATFIITAIALYTNISPGLTAFVLIAASNFVVSTNSICRRYGQLQMDFVAVERVDELLHLEQEPLGTIDPPASWPTYGSDITFENVTIKYAQHLDPSLIDISLRIPGGSTTAVIGRTGSGKSTLAVSLLSVVRATSGQIKIDNINISEVQIQALRNRVTFVAQEPVLFPGSLRHNLDPVGEYSEEDCYAVMQRICGKHNWTLDTYIEGGGRNLSQGQRQLIGLTRAVLRRSPVVILDEATASIDHESSMEIQQILREEMKNSTVVTIAHRLEAVKDADYCIVLDKGRVLSQGPVEEMLRESAGEIFQALDDETSED